MIGRRTLTAVSVTTIVMVISIFLTGSLLTGCLTEPESQLEMWTHVVTAGNYTADGAHGVYRIVDSRFNTRDWYDVWIDDSYWDPELGWSSFESTYDSGTFYYEPEYYDGYAEWNTLSITDIIGATLRFYRMSAEP